MSESNEEASNEPKPQASPETEAVLMAIWRRVIEEGCGPEMSLTEAAAVLGASVGSVRRRVAAGAIPAYRDARGRIRIVPRLNPEIHAPLDGVKETPESQEGPVVTSMMGRLLDELRATREQLNQAVRERSGLQKEKAATEQALEHAKEEVGAMWRLLSARSSSERAEPRQAIPPGDGTRIAHVAPLPTASNVAKIQSQITAVRKLAKRRKWPWEMVS